ncbi:zinc-protease [Salmonella enterica subsp. enterica]|nr:zinc-protease [Salmonella enterica subsp. enterica]
MQGTKIRLLAGSLLMLASAGYVQADALQPDPAWQQGTLANGFTVASVGYASAPPAIVLKFVSRLIPVRSPKVRNRAGSAMRFPVSR